MTIRIDSCPSPIGTIRFVVRMEEHKGGFLCALGFEHGWERLLPALRVRFDLSDHGRGDAPRGILAAISAYFDGDLRALADIRVDPGGTPFQREVWSALRDIPPGRTFTYAELARRIGRPAAARAVGAANGANPVSLAIPCHRIVASDGGLGGYAWGLEKKEWLLAHERKRAAEGAPRPRLALRRTSSV